MNGRRVATPLILPFEGVRPAVDAKAFVAPTAVVVGRVSLREETSIWYGTVLRGDGDTIAVGAGSNIQDGCVVHTDPGFPVRVGTGVSVGHRAVVHGCTIGDDVLVGMGAVVLNGARVGSGTLIAAGAVVLEGADIPPGSLVAGVPGKVHRALTDEERAAILTNAATYRELAAAHARSVGSS